MNNEHLKYGLRPPAQAPPHRGFCPGGRARWLGEIAECGMKTPNFKGMTLIEVIVVMIIIGILAATIIPRFDFTTSSRASVDGAVYMIASDIRYVQECAMANRVSKSITFTLNQNFYTFPATVPSTSSLDPSGRLPSGVTIGTTVTFTFNSLGEPTTSAGWTVTVSGSTKTITVANYTGKVSIS